MALDILDIAFLLRDFLIKRRKQIEMSSSSPPPKSLQRLKVCLTVHNYHFLIPNYCDLLLDFYNYVECIPFPV